ncbi:C-C chemokine receptor type 8-like isoform X1 [Brienomyrus brachyistius]|uniref:C-C chemokine receptor type 8-like isoform X1 n=2 Tax=Brienomyrus brachyistius TaxID=42636 RepID=UPI0020B245A3|nr:C-C chemokine receptor type 8-like isoform X1 [Brienomyrus brachyistius]XP_048880147.1 C-C chemokine receptor type 8-like isoform X1 [Brienomyrus brachyistius]
MDINNFTTESVRSTYSPTDDETDLENFGPCIYERHGTLFLPVFFSLLFVFGVTSNGLVMWVILMSVKLLSITDICLLNLAVADLLLLITLPFLAHYSRADWVFGSGMCKVVMGSYYIGFNSSIFFVVIMSIDRYLAVVHAVKSLRTMSHKYRVIMIIITWVIGLLASFPELTLIDISQQDNTSLCQVSYKSEPFLRVFSLFKMNVTSLLIPFFIMVFCYSMILRRILLCKSTNRKTVRLVLLVVLVFFCCWTPYNVASFFQALEVLDIYTSCKSSRAIQLSLQVTEAVAYSHTCLNPIIYVFVGEKFRRQLFKLMNRMPCMKNKFLISTTASQRFQRSRVERSSIITNVTSF